MAVNIQSTKVSDGQVATAAQYNALIHDLLDSDEGHDHDQYGGTVGHENLSDGVISGTYLNHEAINKHVQGTGTEVGGPDDPGGAFGVHGIPSLAAVLGSYPSQMLIQKGSSQTAGTTVITGSKVDQYKAVTFPLAFGGTPAVVLIAKDARAVRHSVGSITSSGFTAYIGYPDEPQSESRVDTDFDWIAIGAVP